jgi:hypothetical protein
MGPVAAVVVVVEAGPGVGVEGVVGQGLDEACLPLALSHSLAVSGTADPAASGAPATVC